ncbi:MAG: type II secretion system protein [Candidatus Omnitrophica bacterium]|nr:type II secretion system protein [Candidatus Omnitrophota bacterium]
MKAFNSAGFTYIEMLIVVTLVGLCFVPLLQMFAQSVDEVEQYSDLGTALQLGREAMESVKNLRFTEAQIESQQTVWAPSLKEPPLELNQKNWRVKRTAVERTNPLEVHVYVFRAEDLDRPLMEFASLIEDL